MENKDQMSLGKPKNKFLLLASTLFVLLIVLLVLVVINNKPASVTPKQTATSTTGGDTTGSGGTQMPKIAAVNPPTVMVNGWVGMTAPASVPTSASVYTFKTGYTMTEAQALAGQLGIQGKVQKNNNVVMVYSLPPGNDGTASILAYQLSNGTFIYTSSKGVALPTGASVEDKVMTFLKGIGVYDSTLTAVTTYKDKTQPGKLFVEVHRDWKKVGLPILNPMGLLNVPENEKLAALTLASKNSNLPQNSNIYATSDRTDGYVRKSDFNTITLGVDEATQMVTEIKSGIRPFATAAPNTTSLLTFDQAVDKLKMGQYEFALVTPSGNGEEMPWDKIYPMNKAEAETATVTDSVVVYLEQPSSANQTQLIPYYVFRANAMLKSGYRAKIIAAVPAASQTSAFLMPFIGVNAQTPTSTSQGQQQGTFELVPTGGTPNNPNTGVTTAPPQAVTSGVPTLSNGSVCKPTVGELNPIYNIGGALYGHGDYAIWGSEVRRASEGYWYYIPSEGDNAILGNLQNIINGIKGAVATQEQVTMPTQPAANVTVPETATDDQGQKQGTFYVPTVLPTQVPAVQVGVNDVELRVIEKVIKDVNRIGEYCPLRVTGSSPTVFIYGQTGANVQLVSGAVVSYADPSTNGSNIWNVQVGANGTVLANGVTREWIYYEYENATFDRPTHGWTVKKADLASFASTTAHKLGLTATEAGRLQFELEHAASRVSADSVFVGLISKNEVNSKLPLKVSSGYAVERVYFYVGAASGKTVAPSLSKIVRSPSMVVELGSYGEK